MLALAHTSAGPALFATLIFGSAIHARETLSVEVFTASVRPISGMEDERVRSESITTYTVDGLDRFESGLSEGLPADPEAAKAEALRRIQQLDDARMAPAKNAAIGLAKAVQLGVGRYPAIVFDGRAVVYGVTDLVEAVDRYEVWQREQAR